MYEWGRLNFNMAIDEALTRLDNADLGSWYRQFTRDLLHQDSPITTLAKDVIDSARRQTEAEKKRRQRDLLKESNVPQCPTNVPQCPSVVPITDSDSDSDTGINNSNNSINRELEVNNKELITREPKTVPKFTTPTADDVRKYAESIGATQHTADYFHDYQTSKGWKIGSEPMKNWQSAFRNWKRNNESGKYAPAFSGRDLEPQKPAKVIQPPKPTRFEIPEGLR